MHNSLQNAPRNKCCLALLQPQVSSLTVNYKVAAAAGPQNSLLHRFLSTLTPYHFHFWFLLSALGVPQKSWMRLIMQGT